MNDEQPVPKDDDGSYKLDGMLDLETVGQWKKRGLEILGRTEGPVRFDLADAEVRGSAVIALLIALQREGELISKQVEFVNCSEALLSMAEVCGVQDILRYGDEHGSR